MRKLLFLILGIIVLASCKSVRYVSVPEYHETVVHQRDTVCQKDSIFVHDSIAFMQKGDTIFLDRFHTVYKDRWKYQLRVDSFVQRDTVTVVKEVEKPPSTWQKWKMQIGEITLFLCLVAAAGFVISKIIYKKIHL